MDNEHKNKEGYSDPTPYEAMRRISRDEKKATRYGFRPVVYICSPYSGDTETNTRNAETYCRVALGKKAIPFAPHLLYPRFMSEEEDRDLALFMGKVMLDKCAEVWVFGDSITTGMKGEIDRAENRKKAIRYFSVDGKEKKDE